MVREADGGNSDERGEGAEARGVPPCLDVEDGSIQHSGARFERAAKVGVGLGSRATVRVRVSTSVARVGPGMPGLAAGVPPESHWALPRAGHTVGGAGIPSQTPHRPLAPSPRFSPHLPPPSLCCGTSPHLPCMAPHLTAAKAFEGVRTRPCTSSTRASHACLPPTPQSAPNPHPNPNPDPDPDPDCGPSPDPDPGPNWSRRSHDGRPGCD